MATNLEQRVEERTKALSRQALRLQAATDVSRSLSSILNVDELVQKAVDLIQDRFDASYAGLFLLDEQHRLAVLKASSGKIGIKMMRSDQKLEINDSTMIGWSINHKEAHIGLRAADLPLFPNAQSHLALPLITQGQVIGALTVQSEQESAFSPEDVNILQTIVDQLANGIEKARLYEQIQQRAIELDKAREIADSTKNDAEKARAAADEANRNLAAQMWQTTGQALLNEKMRGEQDLVALANNVIQHLCQYLKIENGAIYTLQNKILYLTGTYAYRRKSLEQQYQIGEDQVGQGALAEGIVTYQIPDEYIVISVRQGKLLPKFRLISPISYNKQVSGVITLESMTEFTVVQKHFIEESMESIAIAFATAQARASVNELFVKTRQQAEELQTQEEELRAINEELQAQSDVLRATKV
jgi:GAF domain-containing protein